MNDTERQQWVDNDEGLYDAYRAARRYEGHRGGLRAWVRANRDFIDQCITAVEMGKKPAHWLKYGPW